MEAGDTEYQLPTTFFFPDPSLPARRHLPHKIEVISVYPSLFFFNEPNFWAKAESSYFLLRLEPENVFKS